MTKVISMKTAVFVLMTLFTAQIAAAGWLDNAVEGAKERVGTRAVDEAADGSYDAAKDALFNKEKAGAKGDNSGDGKGGNNNGTAPANDGGRFREAERHRPAPGMSGEALDDEHFIQKDDYFFSTTALEKNSYIRIELAKMVTEPSPRTKGEAEFFKIIDGTNVWSKYFYQSRIARDGDIKLGTQVIVMEGRPSDEGVALPPETKDEARGASWFLAKVTDLSDLYRGYLTVSGNIKVSLKNLRVLLPKTPAPAR
jgi:hypothetical protein